MLQELQNLLFMDVYTHILKELKIMIVSVGVHSLCLCCDSPILARQNPVKPNKLTPCLHCKCKLARTQDLNGCRLARSNSTKLQILANLTTTTIDYATKKIRLDKDYTLFQIYISHFRY